MSKIKIKYFGPIKSGYQENDGWLDIKKVTLFIGNQGSGKSTVAKLISTFIWIEKALVRGDITEKWLGAENRLKNTFLNYHRLENYLSDSTIIEYHGDAYNFKYENKKLSVKEIKNKNYALPQIMYVPAERNFIFHVKSPEDLKLKSASLKEFLNEFDNAKKSMTEVITLPINDTDIEYDTSKDILKIKTEDCKIDITEASSGFQSLVPLYLVSNYLSESVENQSQNKESMSIEEMNRFKKGAKEVWSNDSLTDEQKRLAISALSSKFNKTAFINIVEEPELNLFPSSQWQLLKSLFEFNNLNVGNKLIMTTHSPYIVNYLSVAIQAGYLKEKINSNDSLQKELFDIVPDKSIIDSNDISVYQFDERTGSIAKLKDYEGIPSDENFLNKSLADGNSMFDSLLEIEQEL
ncbi:MAG: ATP-binding protein [Melioribacteraceae bacterium]|nr:ATP-binding protein [Melioribacteraceae bacterium]